MEATEPEATNVTAPQAAARLVSLPASRQPADDNEETHETEEETIHERRASADDDPK